jgi:hypothetical protein
MTPKWYPVGNSSGLMRSRSRAVPARPGRRRRLGRWATVMTGAALLVQGCALVLIGPPPTTPPPHVFVIVLENEGFAAAFGNTNPSTSPDPYLAITLPSMGALIPNYFGIGHVSNDNYAAMISGQAPNPQNQADCLLYDNFLGTGPIFPPGQAIGTGCVFPASVRTVADQLTAKGLTWKGYLEDMGNVAAREAAVCGHPALNSVDMTQSAVAGDGYATRHNPFAYFHSIIDNAAACAHVVPLGDASGALPPSAPAGTTGLATDLASIATTPNLSVIVPNLCNDGHDFPCVNQPSPTGSALGDIDHFVRTWVAKILASPAYQHDGVLAIIFDEAAPTDGSSCCNELPGPNSPLPGITGLGGGQTGAVLLSPAIAGGKVISDAHNHYSLLASIEDYFGLPRLGYAQAVPTTLEQSLSH